MYRFLLSPRWLAAAALAVAAALVMVMLGNWQLRRYEERSATNDRIDAADSIAAVPLASVLSRPTAPGTAGAYPGKELAWTKVTVSGQYDPSREIQARGRTVNGDVGFEIVTPLVLADGTAVLIDRGWVPAPPGGALAAPVVPPAPTGPVTVVGQIHLSESRPVAVERRDGRLDTRRISLPRLAPEMPYPVYGAYVLLTEQTPASDAAFVRIPIDHEDAWQNGGYAVQWWLFALMALAAYVYYARKEAHGTGEPARERSPAHPDPDHPAAADRRPAPTGDRVEDTDRRRGGGDRVEEADRRRGGGDRVEDADRKRAAARERIEPGDRVDEADRRAAAREAARQRADPGDRLEEADRKRAAAAATQGDRVSDADRAREAASQARSAQD
ncbi:SURF1 family protein [Actinoplanes sp. TRM 88003]|uniref:SURF1-like protein n=1 Tax=Paractinoplanes aksuensis TaxID=2939490 RepID=A0ABT1E3Z2_9ACTN|nr:SURF1 family cytochrome oxidase biogenesis protein [Actinoplanes aksuensis]MCO8277844.1 SURF1 family protein [Actinoplanes aksuensis]